MKTLSKQFGRYTNLHISILTNKRVAAAERNLRWIGKEAMTLDLGVGKWPYHDRKVTDWGAMSEIWDHALTKGRE